MSIDERKWGYSNREGHPSMMHKLRILNPKNETGESFGITIPKILAQEFSGCFFKITLSGTTIFMESGCRVTTTITKEVQFGENILAQ